MLRRCTQHPLPLVRIPALIVPDVDGTKDEQSVVVEDGAPPPPLAFDVAAAPPALDVAAVPPDADALDDCFDDVVPPLT
jgi:hypothetical protein